MVIELLSNLLIMSSFVAGFGGLFIWYRMICAVSFSTLTLYVQQASGNPFLNFFGQSIAEAPAHILGTILVDRIGRRLTNSSSSLLAAVCCLPAIFYCTCKWHFFLYFLVFLVHFRFLEFFPFFSFPCSSFICVHFFCLHLDDLVIFPFPPFRFQTKATSIYPI